MSPSAAPLHRLAPAAALAVVLLVAGCGAGLEAQTYEGKAAGNATNDTIGALSVRNLAVLGPQSGTTLRQGSDARVVLTLVNNGGEADRLVSATTPAAASVQVVGPTARLQVPRLASSDPSSSLRLKGLTRDVPAGAYVELTLSFEHNGSKTMLVPVQVAPQNVPRETGTYEVGETDSAGKPIVAPGGDNLPEATADTKGDQGNPTPAAQ